MWNIFILFFEKKSLEDYNQKIRGMQKHRQIGLSRLSPAMCEIIFNEIRFNNLFSASGKHKFLVVAAIANIWTWMKNILIWTCADIMAHQTTNRSKHGNEKFFKFSRFDSRLPLCVISAFSSTRSQYLDVVWENNLRLWIY